LEGVLSYLKYYEEEHARHPAMHAAKPTASEAEEAVKRLWLHFAGRKAIRVLTRGAGFVREQNFPLVKFTKGNRLSCANLRHVTLNTDYLTWLVVIHEVAHSLDEWKEKTGGRSSTHHWHSKHHARWVDKLVAYVEAMGWCTGSLAHELALREETQRNRAQRAACEPSRAERIAHKEGLISRLERKVRSLESRIASHRRSISALRRADAKARGE
jgi:hypothetical protein